MSLCVCVFVSSAVPAALIPNPNPRPALQTLVTPAESTETPLSAVLEASAAAGRVCATPADLGTSTGSSVRWMISPVRMMEAWCVEVMAGVSEVNVCVSLAGRVKPAPVVSPQTAVCLMTVSSAAIGEGVCVESVCVTIRGDPEPSVRNVPCATAPVNYTGAV